MEHKRFKEFFESVVRISEAETGTAPVIVTVDKEGKRSLTCIPAWVNGELWECEFAALIALIAQQDTESIKRTLAEAQETLAKFRLARNPDKPFLPLTVGFPMVSAKNQLYGAIGICWRKATPSAEAINQKLADKTGIRLISTDRPSPLSKSLTKRETTTVLLWLAHYKYFVPILPINKGN